MKRFSILATALVMILTISACGTKATPTANAIDLQGTIAAAAFTSVAETQTAIPTATPVPPTATAVDTPTSLPTFAAVPSLQATIAALPSPGGISSTEDPCIHQVLPAALVGEPIRIRIDNPTRATLNVSVYLQQAGPGTQCGYRAYTLSAGQSLVINDLVVGCYTVWAWNPDPEGYFMVTNGTSCLNTSSTSWTFDVSTNGIRLR